MRKGFTLIELLGVVILISIISLLLFPSIINFIKKGNDTINDNALKLLYNSTYMYIRDNIDNYPKINGNKYCISINSLVSNDYISSDTISNLDYDNIMSKMIQISYSNNNYNYSIIDSTNCTIIMDSYLTRLGYTKLEYIESTGTQYINTNIKSSESDLIDVYVDSVSTSSSSDLKILIGFDDSALSGQYFGVSNVWESGSGAKSNTSYDEEIKLTVSFGTKVSFTINDINYTKEGNISSGNLTLMNGGNAYPFIGYLYSSKIYKNGELIRYYMPYKKDDIYGLYDLLNNKFYQSVSGNFLGNI